MRDKDEQKRARILDSVSTMITEDGVASVSLSKIAKQAGIASGTMYTYFKDKDDMLRQLYLDRNAKLAQAINQVDQNKQPQVELAHFMDLIYQYGQEHLAEMQLIREFVQTPLLHSLGITIAQMYQGYESLNGLVENGVKQGIFEEIEMPVLLSYAYSPTLEYLVAVDNGGISEQQVPFTTVKKLSMKAILK